MPKFIDITGHRFGRLVAIERTGTSPGGQPIWLCQCDCGERAHVRSQSLREGVTSSCGCFNREQKRDICIRRNTTHGESGSAEYRTWCAIKERCATPSHWSYRKYGARGVRVCQRWIESYDAFLADMGRKPTPEHTLDRYPDPNGGYEPDNCRWATQRQQQNNRTNNRILEFRGERRTLAEWAAIVGIKPATISRRLFFKWPVERALTERPKFGPR